MGNRPRRKVKKTTAAASPAPAAASPELVRRMLRTIVVCYLFFAMLYAVQIPFGKGPDETAHVRYLEYLAQHHRLPVFQTVNPGANYEFHQPPLYYVLALPSYLLAQGTPEQKGQTVRLVSAVLGIALLYLVFLLGRRMLPERPWTALAATAVVAFLPMHLHLAASVGNDVLTEVFFAAVLVLAVGYLRAGAEYRAGTGAAPRVTTALWIGAFIGLGMLTKSLAVLLFPLAWFAFALAARGPEGIEWRRLGRDVAACTGVALALCGWWLVRNQVLYGDPVAQRAFLSAFVDRPSPQSMMQLTHLSLLEYVLLVVYWTSASALGVYGPVHARDFVFYPGWVYIVAAAVALVAAIGFVRYLRRERPTGWQAQAWVLFVVLGGLVLASFVRFNLSFFQAQARYLFPALPPVALACCLGLEQYVSGRRRLWVSWGAAGALAVLVLVGLPWWIVPQFAYR